MRLFQKRLSLLLIASLLFASLKTPVSAHAKSAEPDRTAAPEHGEGAESRGLRFRLSQAPDQPETSPTPKAATAAMLSQSETAAILRRLTPIKTDTADTREFAFRERSLLPPRTGNTISVTFPAAENLAVPETTSGTLEVIRFSPEGETTLAPNLSITFSQPMVAVSSQQEAAENIPVTLSPQAPGKWRWVGTRTLLFEPEGRFAMATQYSVTVPAGTRSVNGGTLGKSKTWNFVTPPLTVKSTFPDKAGTQPRDAMMFVEFDQRIDPARVLSTIKVRTDDAEIRTRLATSEEILADPRLQDLAKQTAEKRRWLAFRAIDAQGNTKLALPFDATITVSIEPGTASAEGPGTTTSAQQFSFRTFGPLRIIRTWCGYNPTAVCSLADSPWHIEFSNSLNLQTFQDSQLRIEPALSGAKTSFYGNTLNIEGPKLPDTNYRITILKTLQDQFGQTFDKEQTVEFKTGPLSSLIGLSAEGLVVFEQAKTRRLSLYSVNFQTVRIGIYAVEPEDWTQFQAYRQLHYRYSGNAIGERARLPGRLVSEKQIELKPSPNEMVETAIDLAPALKDGFGQALVVVETILPVADANHNPLLAWVQSTSIGLDAFVDNDELIGWANALADGAPLADVQLQLLPAKVAVRTGTDGVAHLALKPWIESPPSVLVARRGQDVAILPDSDTPSSGPGWLHRLLNDDLRWYVFDDRKLYRPGEEVHCKGWIRRVGIGKGGDLGSLNGKVTKVSYSVKDYASNEVAKGEVPVNALGGFDAAFKLPGNMGLGTAHVEFETQSGERAFDQEDYTHEFQVEEFRRPEFEVSVKTESEAPLFIGGRADVSVAANYFAGGGLPNAAVKWSVSAQPTNFTPPNRDDYTFGKWTPWWTEGGYEGSNNEEFTARTDANGKHRLRIDFDSVNPARPSFVTANASVEDVNRQTWSATAFLLVHPADLYVGMKSERTFVQQGEPLVVQTIVTDLDGKSISNRQVKMHAVQLDWKQLAGIWRQVEVKTQDCSIQSGAEAVKCTFATGAGGVYRISATVRDDRGRANESELTLWVAGGQQPPKTNVVEAQKVELIPDRKEYKGGDTAELLVQAPFYPAEAVMTLRRSGIVKSERFRMDGPTYTVRVPIEEAWTPNVHLQIDLVGAANRDVGTANTGTVDTGTAGVPPADSGNTQLNAKVESGERRVRAGAPTAGGTPAVPVRRPAFASGEINLSIPPAPRRLTVTATPRDKTLVPSGRTTVALVVKDSAGKAVAGSEVALVVVDESVLALANYHVADPVSYFYAQRDGGVSDYHLRKNLVLANPAGLTEDKEHFIQEFWRRRGDELSINSSASEMVTVTSSQISELPINGRNYLSFALLVPGAVASPALGKIKAAEKIRLRENFNALAVFAPAVRTDMNGSAQVQVKLPDNLTRYRVMAIAVADGKQFGSGESAITARLPLMARPSAPRFLNFGDRFELPIVVQNQTASAITVNLAVRATNAQLLGHVITGTAGVPPAVSASARTDRSSLSTLSVVSALAGGTPAVPVTAVASTGRRVIVPANDRVEVRIPATTVKAGRARFQIAAVSGSWSDAAEIELPVWTPATTESFATYGEIDDQNAIAQPVEAPANVFREFGGLQIETSSTQLQQLTDAFLYLQNYPYECSEQLSSRILSVAALRDVLTAFKAKDLPPADEIEAAVARDLKRLQGMQNYDGGFGFWKREDQSWPYLSIHVAHALARARQKNFDVPNEMFEQSQKYLREIESHIPSSYGADTRRAIIAYALYVRRQMDDRDPVRARKLIAEAGLEKLSLESIGWLLSVLSGDEDSGAEVAAIRHLLNNRVTETAGTAHFVCSYSDGDYLVLNSDRRADGVILEALISDQPSSDLIPKIVRGLLGHRTRGRWENTQENVFILLALDRYFNAYEKVTPNFVARVWLGNAYAGEQQFKGRSTDRQQVNVPMAYLIKNDKAPDAGAGKNLILSKDGPGRLYYRIGMNYAPLDLNLKAADFGFTVARTYEALDHAEDVRQDTDGTWHIKAGARVRVRVTMVAPARRYHVALVDPLAAGFEALNPVLATTETIPEDKEQTGVDEYGNRTYRNSGWFDHQNLRDERAEAFTALLWEGVYNYSYVARATTPGAFIVPPAKAEEMYHPETFGRGKTDRIVIE